MLHFVTINVAVCIKPLQYHMYGVVSFIAEPGKTSPPYSTAASTGKLLDPCGVQDNYNNKLSVFRVEWKLFSKRFWKLNLFLISSLIF
jgi:hypothetical protein